MKEQSNKVAERVEKSRNIIDEYKEKGYRAENLTLEVVKANILACAVMLPAIILMFGVYKLVNGSFALTQSRYIIFVAVMLAEIVVHELIHGFFWGILTGKRFKNIQFGVILKMLTPYCYCETPMKKGSYVLGGIMPTVVLGIGQYIAAMCMGSAVMLWLAGVGVLGGGADVVIAGMIIKRVAGKETLVIDHPSTVGCIVLEKLQPGEEQTADNAVNNVDKNAEENIAEENMAENVVPIQKNGEQADKRDKSFIMIIVLSVATGIVFIALFTILGALQGRKAGEKKAEEEIAILEKTADLSWVEDLDDVAEIYADPGFERLSDLHREQIVGDALEQLRDSYGFAEYELGLKNRPANVVLIYPDGKKQVFALEDFDPQMN